MGLVAGEPRLVRGLRRVGEPVVVAVVADERRLQRVAPQLVVPVLGEDRLEPLARTLRAPPPTSPA